MHEVFHLHCQRLKFEGIPRSGIDEISIAIVARLLAPSCHSRIVDVREQLLRVGLLELLHLGLAEFAPLRTREGIDLPRFEACQLIE